MSKLKTIGQFIISEQLHFPDASGKLSSLLNDITIAAKIVNSQVNKAGLINILGDDGTTNVHGESVKKLDIFANEQFIKALSSGGQCCAIASEENEDIINLDDSGKYVVCIDPLDGSDGVTYNSIIGTIFSIYKRLSDVGTKSNIKDCLQKGINQVASGFFLFGPSTIFILTTGNGVNGFTLYPSVGEFFLSHPNINISKNGKIYSINEGNYFKFPIGVKKYIKYCQKEDKSTDRPYTTRYMGSMVGDIFRTLIKGGIFMYPTTSSYPNGKLRLLYECNPMSFIIEQAGGISINEYGNRIMDIQPSEIHQRTSIYLGSENMIEKMKEFILKNRKMISKH